MSSIIKVDTIQNQSGANIISESANTITVGASGDTITVPSGATLNVNGTVGTFSGQNYPAFSASMSANQTITEAATVLVQFDVEDFDSDSAFNNTGTGNGYSFTVPSGKAGKYYIFTQAIITTGAVSNLEYAQLSIFVNGSVHGRASHDERDNESQSSGLFRGVILDLSVGDYIQVYARCGTANSSNPLVTYGSGRKDTIFGGYRIGA